MSEQMKIVIFLDKFVAKNLSLVSLYKTKKNAFAELKQSLLHQAFTGKLVDTSNATDYAA